MLYYPGTTHIFEATYNCPTRYLVHEGGTNSGKTYGTLQAIGKKLTDKRRLATVAGQDIPNLKVGALRDWQTIVNTSKVLQKEIINVNKSERTYTFKNGSAIEFNSYDDPQDARSGKRDIFFANEANGIAFEVFEELQIRTNELVIIDFNPTAEFWAHEKFKGRESTRWVTSTWKHNPFINKDILAQILAWEPTPENIANGTANAYKWTVHGLGQPGRLEGLIFPNYEVGKVPDLYKWVIYGMDFGYTNDPTTLIEIYYAGGKLHARQLIYETGLTNPQIAQRLKQINFDRNSVIIADSAEPKSIKELQNLGWNVKPAKKGPDSIKNGLDQMHRYPIVIDPGSKDLIKEFANYTWAKDRHGKPQNKPVDDFNHGIDAFRYALSRKLSAKVLTVETY